MLRRYHPLQTGLTVPIGTIGVVSCYLGCEVLLALFAQVAGDPTLRQQYRDSSVTAGFATLGVLGLSTTVVALAGVVFGSFRRESALRLYRRACVGLYVMLGLFAVAAGWSVAAVADYHVLINDGLVVTNADLVWGWWGMFWPAGFAGTIVALLHIFSMRRGAVSLYSGRDVRDDQRGDVILENLRTHGPDPAYRKSFYCSAVLHWLLILGLPWLLSVWGCVRPYRIPEGSGNPVVMLVKIVKPKKKEPRKYILRPDSAIYFEIPDLDESELEKEVKQETELTYEANPDAMVGMIGQGGGKEGGWPEGMGREPIRFIRLKYHGPDWDDGMGGDGADVAFLKEFERITGFKTERRSEAHGMTLLAKYPKGYAPPFVYMTGGNEVRTSSDDRKALREYCLDGGMLFADAGSRHFDRHFRAFVKQVFPGKQLRVIADDDPIFRMPYQFPDGAPPIWAHGGRKALGIKHKGRWCVFYHPGDLNDAWKDRRIHGLSKEMTDGAFEMGVNIVYYSFTNYLEATKKYRK